MNTQSTPSSPRDRTLGLVAQAQQGAPEAVEALVRAASGRLYGFVLFHMGSAVRRRHDPEDVLQEVWIQALSSLPSFDQSRGSSFHAWLAAIARRRLARLAEMPAETPEAELHAPASSSAAALPLSQLRGALSETSPSQRAGRKEALGRLVEAVAALPAEQREAAAAHWFEDCDAAQIASRLGKSRDAVYMLLMRASRALARTLDGLAATDPEGWK